MTTERAIYFAMALLAALMSIGMSLTNQTDKIIATALFALAASIALFAGLQP